MTRKRVLVIDDDPGVRICMESILESLGMEVYSVRDGVEGIRILKQNRIDVLFVDLRLTESDGIKVAEEATSIQPRLSTVIVTGYPSVQSSVAALHNGFCDYIMKPVTQEKIQAALARAAADNTFFQDVGGGAKGKVLMSGQIASCEIAIASRTMGKVLTLAKELAKTDAPVLIQGEKGVGKTLLARVIHRHSNRAAGAFGHLLCNGIREEDLDEALWSAKDVGKHLTAADAGGRVRAQAQTGSLFLDDVNELPSWAQARLLDALEQRDGALSPSARLIVSASCDLEVAVNEGRFSQELYFYLNVASIQVPPLRRRREDIRPLAEHLLDRFKHPVGPRAANSNFRFSSEAWDRLTQYDWPGNVDELANVLKRAVLLARSSEIEAAVIEKLLRPDRLTLASAETITVPLEGNLRKIQRQIVCEVIDRCSGNKAAAARFLGLHRKTLYRLLQEDDRSPEKSSAGVAVAAASP